MRYIDARRHHHHRRQRHADHTGDGGPRRGRYHHPFGLLFGSDGRLLIFDTESHTIRQVDLATGTIRTVIGNAEQGFSGDGGPATSAMVYRPHNGVLDGQGNLVFGDSFNQRIRRWDPRTGVITTIAGTGERGGSQEGTAARAASFTYFGAMVYDREGLRVRTTGSSPSTGQGSSTSWPEPARPDSPATADPRPPPSSTRRMAWCWTGTGISSSPTRGIAESAG